MAQRRGIYERVKGSGIWWVRWTDLDGRKRRELAGTRGAAEKLLGKRHSQKLAGRKLPENLRTKGVAFRELCEDALAYSRAENSAKQTYELGLRVNQLIESFGSRAAESIRKNEIVAWLAEQAKARKWAPASRNRWQATFSLVFRVGIDDGGVARNPAARDPAQNGGQWPGQVPLRHRGETPCAPPSKAASRSSCRTSCSQFIPGMRMGEQSGLRWRQVDFERRQLHLLRTKNGDPRTIPLNAVALAALQQMRGEKNRPGAEPVFPSARTGDSLQGSRGWLSTALEEAKIQEYTWHLQPPYGFPSRLADERVWICARSAEFLGTTTLEMVSAVLVRVADERRRRQIDRLINTRCRRDARTDTNCAARRRPKILDRPSRRNRYGDAERSQSPVDAA